jgi:tetratricopeptide (TPR) repeat protein
MTFTPPARHLAIAAIYAAAAWLVYGATLHAPFLLDDQHTIHGNPAIHSWWPLTESLNPPPRELGFARRPAANLSMALNFAMSDLDPRSYRITNLLLHAGNAFLLFLVLGLLLRRAAPRIDPSAGQVAAFLAGLIWVVHPLATSAVHYLTQRPEMLMTTGLLVMCYAQLRSQDSRRPRAWLTLAAVGCLFGMGSKESMALAPLLAMLLDRCSTSWSWREQFRHRAVYYAILWATLAWPLSRLSVESSDVVGDTDLERRWRYFLTVSEGVVRHVWLTLWPARLVFDYGMVLVENWTRVAWHLAVVLTAGGGVFFGLWRRSILAWAGAVFFAVLLPSWINLVPGQPVAEHRFYLPLGILLSLGAVGAARLVTLRPPLARPALALALLITGVLGFAAQQRAVLYAEPIQLMTADITAWPRSDRGYFNLGLVQEFQEDYAAATESYRRSMQQAAGINWRHLIVSARMMLRTGENDEAIEWAAAALRQVVEAQHENDMRTLSGVMISSFRATGQLPLLPEVLRRVPPGGALQTYLDQMALQVNAELEGSAALVREFTDSERESTALRLNLAVALIREGRHEEALVLVDEVLADLPPDTPPRQRADILSLREGAAVDETDRAATLNEALRLDPNHGEALNNLAWLLATADDPTLFDPARAVELARKACRLSQGQAFFHGTLAVALAASGEEEASRKEAVEARKLAERSGVQLTELDAALQRAIERSRRGAE